MKDRRAITILLVTILVLISFPLMAGGSNAETGPYAGDFLLDYGNGYTEWLDQGTGETYSEVISSTLDKADIDHAADLSSIDGIAERTVGGDSSGGALDKPGRTGTTVTSSCAPASSSTVHPFSVL